MWRQTISSGRPTESARPPSCYWGPARLSSSSVRVPGPAYLWLRHTSLCVSGRRGQTCQGAHLKVRQFTLHCCNENPARLCRDPPRPPPPSSQDSALATSSAGNLCCPGASGGKHRVLQSRTRSHRRHTLPGLPLIQHQIKKRTVAPDPRGQERTALPKAFWEVQPGPAPGVMMVQQERGVRTVAGTQAAGNGLL